MSERQRSQDVEDSADLRELFRTLRSRDEESAPDFQGMMARARSEARRGSVRRELRSRGGQGTVLRTPRSRLLAGTGLLAAAALGALILVGPDPSPDRTFEEAVRSFSSDPALGAWRSPTRGLLSVPGMELLRTVPEIGGPTWPGRPDESPRSHSL